jgi:hypothetical protein
MPAYTQICRPNIFGVLCRNSDAGLSGLRVGGPAYKVQGEPTVISGIYLSEELSRPYNQGRKHHSMVAECDDRVHSGGMPTLTVHKYKLTSGR